MALNSPISASALAATPGATPQICRYVDKCVVMNTSWKPQAKNAAVMNRYPRWLIASRAASPSFCFLVTTACVCDGSRIGNDSNAMDPAIAANPIIAAFQPKPSMSHCPSGASTIVPREPIAATRPTVWVRRSGGVARAMVPIRTPKPVPAVPMPARKPASWSAPGKDLANTISASPAA